MQFAAAGSLSRRFIQQQGHVADRTPLTDRAHRISANRSPLVTGSTFVRPKELIVIFGNRSAKFMSADKS
jgi:hypothetical protein